MSQHLGFLRNNFYGNAQLVLQKCGFTQPEAARLCRLFHLQIAQDLCRLTDVDCERIPWLGHIPSMHLHDVCAICRQIQLEKDEAKENARLKRAALWTPDTHSVYDRNGDLHALLESLQG
jgi:hypothetical protein